MLFLPGFLGTLQPALQCRPEVLAAEQWGSAVGHTAGCSGQTVLLLPDILGTLQPALQCRPEFLERKLAQLEMDTMLIIMDELWIEFLQVG